MATTPSTTENERIARRFPEEVAADGNVDLIHDICAEDVIDHSPFGEVHGRDELKEVAESVISAFPDLSVTIEDSVAAGDMVANRLTLRGTHEGEFMGIEPTGEAIEIQNMLFTRVEDGLITERWVQPDMLGFMQQIGAVDPPTK